MLVYKTTCAIDFKFRNSVHLLPIFRYARETGQRRKSPTLRVYKARSAAELNAGGRSFAISSGHAVTAAVVLPVNFTGQLK